MTATRTLITEIVTGLGMLGFRSLEHALTARPAAITNVTDEHYEQLAEDFATANHRDLYHAAWSNGEEFARATEGLRGRPPWWIEWKGNHRPPRYEQIPADLRVDHVYLISCKYGSNILTNSSPANLFDRQLADRRTDGMDWFAEVAPDAYQAFYAACRDWIRSDLSGATRLPDHVVDLDDETRGLLKARLPRRLTGGPAEAYAAFAREAAAASAKRWRANLTTPAAREEMLWRLLRLQSAPYFVLGESAAGVSLRYRVATPWDFRNDFRLRRFDIDAAADRKQPVVHWMAEVIERATGSPRSVQGHVEVRWSHGKFAGSPEAKVYLDTPHHDVPGYVPLDRHTPGGQLLFHCD